MYVAAFAVTAAALVVRLVREYVDEEAGRCVDVRGTETGRRVDIRVTDVDLLVLLQRVIVSGIGLDLVVQFEVEALVLRDERIAVFLYLLFVENAWRFAFLTFVKASVSV